MPFQAQPQEKCAGCGKIVYLTVCLKKKRI